MKARVVIIIIILLLTNCEKKIVLENNKNIVNNSLSVNNFAPQQLTNEINEYYIVEIKENEVLFDQLETPLNIIVKYAEKNHINNYNNIQELLSILNIEEINRLLQINEDKKTREFNSPVRNIQEYILKDLNIFRNNFNSIEEILSGINLDENYTITESEIEINYHGGGIMDVFLIEWVFHKFTIYKVRGYNGYSFGSLLIEINDNNYKKIFPYELMKEYLSDNNFGELYSLRENSIVYTISEENQGWLWFVNLIFNDNTLKSISIYPFTP